MKTLFKGGTIIDGSGEKPYVGDVLIEDDAIVSVAAKSENGAGGDGQRAAEGDTAIGGAAADRVIDIKGMYICPGLIDGHSHNDFFCDRDDAEKYFKPFIEQGITTQITGNCSFSPFGMDADTPHKDKLGGGLFDVACPGDFKSFKERVQGRLFVNIVPLIGQGSVRAGLTGYDSAPLTEEQIAREVSFVREAMEGGAFGGSFGFMYEPDRYAAKDEINAFAKAVAEYDGIITIHPRANSAVSADYPLFTKKSHLELGLDEAIEIARESGCRLEYSHLILVGKRSWKYLGKMLKSIYDARREGLDVAYDNYAFHYGASVITVVFPEWYAKLSPEEAKKPANRLKLSATILMYRKILGIDWDDMVVAYISDEHTEYEGMTVLDAAKKEGLKPLDMYLKLVELSDRKGTIYLGRYYNAESVRTLMEDELSIFMTDAWVEEKGLQNIAAFQTFPQFFLLAKRDGIPVEKVVRKMTGQTADRFKIEGRGYLKAGYKADITVIDPVKLSVNERVPDQKPGGIEYVYVNGRAAIEGGEYIGARAGEIAVKKK